MSITPYLRSRAFEPETVKAMGIAFENACRKLGLSRTPDAVTEGVAKVVIALAEHGETDAECLHDQVMAQLGHPT